MLLHQTKDRFIAQFMLFKGEKEKIKRHKIKIKGADHLYYYSGREVGPLRSFVYFGSSENVKRKPVIQYKYIINNITPYYSTCFRVYTKVYI